jgi:predicted RNA-binding Zn-ribbon protein involved in translation (DUF1610 family)
MVRRDDPARGQRHHSPGPYPRAGALRLGLRSRHLLVCADLAVAAMKENPYAIYCPECGKTICYRCEKIEQNIASEMDACDDADRHYIQRQQRLLKAHKAEYDHRWIGENDRSLLVMRLG